MSDSTAVGMLCPACKVDLVIAERQNIEIDYCPKCRGVWLDRGELDKIVERSAIEPAPRTAAEMPARAAQERYGGYDDEGRRSHGKYATRKKSWLSELFD